VELVASTAAQAGDRIACAGCGESFTYREVVAESDVLAARVDVREAAGSIALALPRSPWLSVAALACLKVGRPFLPISLEEPEARMREMVETARAETVVALPGTELPPPLAKLDRVEVARTRNAVGERLDAIRPYDGAAAAYILFTSGSTGVPKGVQVRQEALLNRLLWAQRAIPLTADDVVLQKTPATFDVSIWELLWPLVAGARVHFLAPGDHVDPGVIVDAIVEAGVTVCHFVPSMLREFVTWPGAPACTSLRHVLCSGEALTPELVCELARVSSARLHNLYGPTEAAIDVAHWEVPAPRSECRRVLIGRPVANTDLAVVDDDLRPVPSGEAGELCIGGVQLADGYVGRPDLTAEAFVRGPDGERVYRTGDRARVVDGELEFLGRIDDQVKVRGVRVEPSEVERAIAVHPGVDEAVVVGYERAARTELAAFVRTRPGAILDPSVLRALVQERLPSQFVPTDVHFVATLPSTPVGKRDRRELRRVAERAAVPTGPTTNRDELAARWGEALQRPGFDPDAGFLDLGGHSLAAARLAGQLLETFGVRMPLSWLVRENISLAQLRERLEAAVGDGTSTHNGAAAARTHPLGRNQRRLWLVERMYGTLAPYNVVSVLALDAPLDADRLRTAIEAVAAAQPGLRTGIALPAEGEPMQLVANEPAVPLTVAHVDAADFDEQGAALAARLQWLDIASTEPPLYRVVMLADGLRTALGFVASHLVADQHSVEIFWRDLAAAYAGQPLREAVVRAAQDGPADARALEHWRRELEGAVPMLRLPFQRPRPERPTFKGKSVIRRLGGRALAVADEAAAAHGVPRSVYLLTAFAQVLLTWSGQSEVVVAVPTDSRRTLDEAGAMGFFVDTVPIRIRQDTDLGLPRQVDAALRTGIACANVGFEEIAAALHVPRRTGVNPVFQAWFNDLSLFGGDPEFAGVPARRLRAADAPALFDVALYVHTRDDDLELEINVSCDIFDDKTADRLADAVLAALGEAEDRVEVRRTGVPARPKATPGETTGSLFGRFQSMDRRGAGPALRLSSGDIGYDELAAAVAATAQDLEAGSEPIGIKAARVPALAVLVLAAWKAQRPVVLVDAALPHAAIEAALRRAGARQVADLTRAGSIADLPPLEPLAGDGGREPLPPSAWDGISHALMTTGTTDAPRLVLVRGDAFATALLEYATALELTGTDRFVVLAGAAHDPVFRDLLLPLTLGASTTLLDEKTLADPVAAGRALRAARPTVLHMTPTRASLLSSALEENREQIPSVRAVVIGGDGFPTPLVPMLRTAFPGAAILNAYGTTEISQVSSLHVVEREYGDRAYVPIGRGLGSRSLLVVAGSTRCSTGELGEIAVEEPLPLPMLADGVLPTRRVDDRTVVITGDKGRLDPYGDIEWCGRADGELVVHARRIDPAAIESLLREDECVLDAVVGALGKAGAAPRLAAFVVLRRTPDSPSDVVLADLRDRLRAALPAWSVPSSIEMVPSIVVDRNGKANAAATAALVRKRQSSRGLENLEHWVEDRIKTYLPPGARIAPDTNFFEAGLDSLAMLSLHADLTEHGHADLAVTDLFRWPNVRGLAAALATNGDHAPHARHLLSLDGDEHTRRRRVRAALGDRNVRKELPWTDLG
jgi:amino acid adenylation domain-containing protein